MAKNSKTDYLNKPDREDKSRASNKSPRDIITIDRDTGEELKGKLVFVPEKKRNGFGEGWVAMNQEVLQIFATSDLSGRDFKVLMKLLSILDFENLIQVSQADLAEELGMQRTNINRSIKVLINMQAVLEGPKIGRSKTYRLNPYFGWKGSSKNHKKALESHLRLAIDNTKKK